MVLARACAAKEAVEDERQFVFPDPRSVIADLERCGEPADVDDAPGRAVMPGVIEDVVDHTRQLLRHAGDRARPDRWNHTPGA
jgi:hypothetical protein